MKIAPFVVASLVVFTGFQTLLEGLEPYTDYDIEHMNEFWSSEENHVYCKRTNPSSQSVEIAENIVSNDDIFLLRYWDSVKISKSSMDWSEDPFDDTTWQFYYHSLRMVSYLVSSYESTGEIKFLEEAKWYIESWIEHNPGPKKQASEKAWKDHSTANRICTFLQFWDSYRDSPIEDEYFSKLFLNILRLHGEFTADPDNYYWGHNHGIYQDRALLQLAILFPHFEQSGAWKEVAAERLEKHLHEDFTESGVHKEHSPAYHYLALSLMMSIDEFNKHYHMKNKLLESKIYSMQEYLAYIVKPDGTFPLVGDSGLEYGLRIKESDIVSENLLNLKLRSSTEPLSNHCIGYEDSGVAINKLQFTDGNEFYLSMFSAFHSTAHKQSDDLSFVLTYGQTDYFVDSGKYNYDESDKFRQYVRSVFAHNTLVVDDQTYDSRDLDNVGKSELYYYKCEEDYSIFRGKHSFYQGVQINRNVVIVYEKGVFIHDTISSNQYHKYSQNFHIGNDVEISLNDNGEMALNSTIDNTSISMFQLEEFENVEFFSGSTNPLMGWRSETFNQIDPISSVVYTQSGKDVEFRTLISLGQEDFTIVIHETETGNYQYEISDDNGAITTIE